MEKTNACLKNNELTSILDEHFKGKINMARVMMAHLICGLRKVRNVSFKKLANIVRTSVANQKLNIKREHPAPCS